MNADKYTGFRAFNIVLRILSLLIIALLLFVPLSGQDFFGGSGLGPAIWFLGLAAAIFIRLVAMLISLGIDIARDLARTADAAQSLTQHMARANALSEQIALTTGRTAQATETTARYIELANIPPQDALQTPAEQPSNAL
jgi:hypothetical protein